MLNRAVKMQLKVPFQDLCADSSLQPPCCQLQGQPCAGGRQDRGAGTPLWAHPRKAGLQELRLTAPGGHR